MIVTYHRETNTYMHIENGQRLEDTTIIEFRRDNEKDIIKRYCCDKMKCLLDSEKVYLYGKANLNNSKPELTIYLEQSEGSIDDIRFCMYCGEKLELQELEKICQA